MTVLSLNYSLIMASLQFIVTPAIFGGVNGPVQNGLQISINPDWTGPVPTQVPLQYNYPAGPPPGPNYFMVMESDNPNLRNNIPAWTQYSTVNGPLNQINLPIAAGQPLMLVPAYLTQANQPNNWTYYGPGTPTPDQRGVVFAPVDQGTGITVELQNQVPLPL